MDSNLNSFENQTSHYDYNGGNSDFYAGEENEDFGADIGNGYFGDF